MNKITRIRILQLNFYVKHTNNNFFLFIVFYVYFLILKVIPFRITGTGGIVIVNEYGAFKLQPRGGIPKVMLKPSVYTVGAIGDKGSRATTPLKVFEKKE